VPQFHIFKLGRQSDRNLFVKTMVAASSFPPTRATSPWVPIRVTTLVFPPMRSLIVFLYLILFFSLVPSTYAVGECLSPCPEEPSTFWNDYPICARSGLGCIRSADSLAHSCGTEGCCVGNRLVLYGAFDCVSRGCRTEIGAAQRSWELFVATCAKNGYQVDSADTPAGYATVSFAGTLVSSATQTAYRADYLIS
jgi:hypothetical protein